MNRKRRHSDEVEDFYSNKKIIVETTPKTEKSNGGADDHNSIEYYIKGEKLDTQDTKIVTSYNHVYFYSSITRATSADLITRLLNIDYTNIEDMHKNKNDIRPIYLHMLSEGGDIFAALAIYQNIKRLKSPVHCYVNGFLSSAAIIVLLACEKRFMDKNTFLGIHSIKMSVWGKLQFLQQCNDNYQKIWSSLEALYKENTKLGKFKKEIGDIKTFMTEPQLLDSKTALKYGFITELI
jgi:ATP-dependent protease ClpP protease subunit